MSLHDPQLIDIAYLVAATLLIIGLRKLGSPRTARSGNFVAGIGMAVGLAATLLHQDFRFSGTGIVLIVVGVALETFRQIDAHRQSLRYDAFLKGTVVRSRSGGGRS